MAKIGDWVWHKNEWGDKFVGQVTGFEPDGRVLIYLYPTNPGGQGKTVYDNLDRLYILTEGEKSNMPVQDAYSEGYEMGRAMSNVFKVSESLSFDSAYNMGERFANMSGYGNLREGVQYVKGFVAAVLSAQPKQVESPKGE